MHTKLKNDIVSIIQDKITTLERRMDVFCNSVSEGDEKNWRITQSGRTICFIRIFIHDKKENEFLDFGICNIDPPEPLYLLSAKINFLHDNVIGEYINVINYNISKKMPQTFECYDHEEVINLIKGTLDKAFDAISID